MMLETKHFGLIDVDESGAIIFRDGILGFEDTRKYIFLAPNDSSSPFRWLQSIDRPDLAFVVINPFLIKEDYDIEIPDGVIKDLGIESEQDVEVYSIVVVPEDKSKLSMNLKAPVVINVNKKLASQVILDTDRYSVRHYILDELREREVARNAGTHKEKGSVHNNK